MDLTPYIDNLRQDFLLAAEARGEGDLAVAAGLVAPLDSSVRLTLLGALSAAADEITRDLAPGAVEVRLRGLDPTFVVTPPPSGAQPAAAAPDATGIGRVVSDGAPRGAGDEGAVARINFRPPEHLKLRIEDAANREGLSVNAWLVRAVTTTLNGGGTDERRPPRVGGQHFSGWVR